MTRSTHIPMWTYTLVLGACLLAISSALGEPPEAKSRPGQPQISVDKSAESQAHAGAAQHHPLTWVLSYARQEQRYLQQTVRAYTCRLVKRERIDGILQDINFIDMKVREEVRRGDGVEKPFATFLYFLGPARVAGRKVLYIDGQNDGKMLVRNGGKHFEYVVVQIDPKGESAREESLVPITESGFDRILSQMILILDRHVVADPSGANTKTQRIPGARINKRPCTVIRVEHPQKQAGLEFHVASVFVDDELHAPVRVELLEWPGRPNAPAPLLAEYTYTNLKINVDVTDADFEPHQLRRNN